MKDVGLESNGDPLLDEAADALAATGAESTPPTASTVKSTPDSYPGAIDPDQRQGGGRYDPPVAGGGQPVPPHRGGGRKGV